MERNGGWESPHVSTSESGSVTFEWWSGDKKLTLYFDDLHMKVVRVWGEDINSEMDIVDLPHVLWFGDVWAWLYGK